MFWGVSIRERDLREIENTWIELSDGTRLAARIWLPVNAEAVPVPAILEYLPYRKRDGTYARDALTHPWFAAHGYAGVRVDIRGSGESDGLLSDEYAREEQDDALEVIAWIARQPWCSGAVGMMGISWGGFNALQVAARRPPALRAIITVCSTDDRYADDVHFMGGALLSATFTWFTAFTSILAHPPDPAIVGERWRNMWRERLEAMPLFVAPWLRHQRRDDYWRHGSICEDWGAITCPVFAVGGWTDAYTNSVSRLLANLRVPRQGLIGPWAHKYPHMGVPGPAVGFLQEALRWWDRWLKGAQSDAPEPPMLRAWMMESVEPAPTHAERPGRWIAEPVWPARSVATRALYLTKGELRDDPGEPDLLGVHSPEYTGAAGGSWCPFGLAPDDADDQREDDALSVSWDSPPLGERMEILGAPELTLSVTCDAPEANLIARLCDVHPNGASLRVSYGVLNLTHRDGHADPSPLEPGRRYRVRLRLNDVAFAFPPGHRIRLALSTAYWPIVWPAASGAPIEILAGRAMLTLPLRDPRAEDATVRMPPPDAAPPARTSVLREGRSIREIGRELGTGERFWRAVEEPHRVRIERIGTEIETRSRLECRIRDDDPLSARLEAERFEVTMRGPIETWTELRARLRASATSFEIEASLGAYEADTCVCRREWHETIPRDLV